MMRLYKKLHSRLGETLVETMAAILIFTFSSIILLSMIAAATKLNAAAKESDSTISAELNAAESQDGAGEAASITIHPSESSSQTVSVNRFSSGDGTLYSYSFNKEPA